jgi:hypothetical protein
MKHAAIKPDGGSALFSVLLAGMLILAIVISWIEIYKLDQADDVFSSRCNIAGGVVVTGDLGQLYCIDSKAVIYEQ